MSRPKLRPDWELYKQTTTADGIETRLGQVVSVIDALNKTSGSRFDALGRSVRSVDANGNGVKETLASWRRTTW